MATIGFEFAYMLDGSGAIPVQRDFILGLKTAHLIGDLMIVKSDGFIDAFTTGTGLADKEVTCVMAEAKASADISAGTTKAKAWIITHNQVWRCSTDAATAASALLGVKTWDTADKNTIKGDDVTGGPMIVAEGEPGVDDIAKRLDDDGNIIGYVVFVDTTFGNT